MSRDTAIGLVIGVFLLVFGVGLGLSEYYDHVENMAKIERGCDE